jgi:hypothetical protein
MGVELGIQDKHIRPLKTLCDNIWLHMGWHAPCELLRIHISSALDFGLWSHLLIPKMKIKC